MALTKNLVRLAIGNGIAFQLRNNAGHRYVCVGYVYRKEAMELIVVDCTKVELVTRSTASLIKGSGDWSAKLRSIEKESGRKITTDYRFQTNNKYDDCIRFFPIRKEMTAVFLCKPSALKERVIKLSKSTK